MSTYTWSYGAEGSGLYFTITYDSNAGTFTVESIEGSFDLNALWFSDGDTTSDGYTLTKSDSSLNMNGSNTVWDDDGTATSEKIVWDDYAKLSSTGLGSEGESKLSFISDGETAVFSLTDFGLTDFDPETYDTLGVRATSVNGDGSIKFVDSEPEVSDGNVAPVAVDDLFNVTEADVELADSSTKHLVGNVLTEDTGDSDADGDTLTVTAVTQPTITETDPGLDIISIVSVGADGGEVARYQITTNFGDAFISVESDGDVLLWSDSGEDPFKALGVTESADIEFTYTISDGNGGTDTADVTITISGTNDSPTASDDVWILSNATTATLSSDAVLLNDTDVDGDSLTIQSVSDSTLLRDVNLNGDSTITYTNGSTSTTADSFDYVISDGNSGTDIGTVEIEFVATGNTNPGGNDNVDLSSETYDASYIDGKGFNDTLTGTTVDGAAGLDILIGSGGNDHLFGNLGDDQLFGGDGSDELHGGAGADVMSGGNGNDTFGWVAGDMADTTNDHFDVITDWGNGNDTLDISDLLADFGFLSGTDVLADWVNVTVDGTDTVVAVATSAQNAADQIYTNLVTLQGVTESFATLNIDATP